MRFQIYKAKDGYRWRAVAQNKLIVAESGEAYSSASSAMRAVRRFKKAIPDAAISAKAADLL